MVQQHRKRPFFGGQSQGAFFSPVPDLTNESVQTDAHLEPQIQRTPTDLYPPPSRTRVNGNRVRNSPQEGVDLGQGTLHWTFEFKGHILHDGENEAGEMTTFLGKDVEFTARFLPANGLQCPRLTFVQSVLATTNRVSDTGHLMYTREAQSGQSMDVGRGETEPYYGAGGISGGTGLQGDVGQTIGSTQGNNPPVATHGDAPYVHSLPPGTSALRRFESAIICVETGETFGSIHWGYTKTSDGTITLLNGRPADVRRGQASATLERVRQAFYQGEFQHSLSNFARGSSRLTSDHLQTLRSIPRQNLSRITLVGANDNSGGPEANANLSLQRAQSARSFLIRLGVPRSIIQIEGHGVAARIPNPAGQQIPGNRRVDIHFEQGEDSGSLRGHQRPPGREGSNRERNRINRQNPWFTVQEAVDLIIQLDNQDRVSMGEYVQLLNYLGALHRWRGSDPTVPDLRQSHGSAIQRIRDKANPRIPRSRPSFERRDPLEAPNLTDQIREDARGL